MPAKGDDRDLPSVLIVDDDRHSVELLMRHLRRIKNFQTAAVENGMEALKYLLEQSVDLILLDVQMPVLDGFETYKLLKQYEQTRQIPVIFITAAADFNLRLQGLLSGAVDYINKPFDCREVVARINIQLELRKLNHQLVAQNHQLECEIAERARVETALKRQCEKLLLLRQITDEIRSTLDPQQVFQTAAERIGNAFQVDRCSIYFIEFDDPSDAPIAPAPIAPVTAAPVTAAPVTAAPDDSAHPAQPVPNGDRDAAPLESRAIAPLSPMAEHCQPAAAERAPDRTALDCAEYRTAILVRDRALAHSDPAAEAALAACGDRYRNPAAGARLSVRTTYQGQPNGIISLTHQDRSRVWTEDEVELLEAVAAQLGVALAQAAQHAKLRQVKEELVEANRALERLAMVDGLTQVANRRQFDAVLRREWHRLARDGRVLSLVLCDLDDFKRFNDYYGHQKGDDCLVAVARVLQQSARRATDLVARYGGEEFALVLPETDRAGAASIIERVRQALDALCIPHARSRVSPFVTLSAGIVSQVPDPFASPEQAIARADRALYEAKARGRNGFCFWEAAEKEPEAFSAFAASEEAKQGFPDANSGANSGANPSASADAVPDENSGADSDASRESEVSQAQDSGAIAPE